MSPDLNPMNYAIWPALKELVYFERTTPFTEAEIKDKIAECWNELSIEAIRATISSWKKRLCSVFDANGLATDHLRFEWNSQRCILIKENCLFLLLLFYLNLEFHEL